LRAKFDEDQKNLPLVDRAVISATRAAGAVCGMLKDLPLRKKVEAGANRFMDDKGTRSPGFPSRKQIEDMASSELNEMMQDTLSKNPTDFKADYDNPTRWVPMLQIPGMSDLFSDVRRTTASAYGKWTTGGVKAPDKAFVYGNRGAEYNIPGTYDVKDNKLVLSAKTLEDFARGPESKGYSKARQTIAHELTHYMQDMYAGDTKTLFDEKQAKRFGEANKRLRNQGLSPDTNGSSSVETHPTVKLAEEMAEMVAAKMAGTSTRLNQTVPIDGTSVASDAAAKALNGLGSSAVFASRQLDAFAARLQSAFPAMAALAPSAPLPPQSARRR
jgi:hypothetical protein